MRPSTCRAQRVLWSSTRDVLLFSLSRNRHHVCVDTEELSTSFAGITSSVTLVASTMLAPTNDVQIQYGRVTFDSPVLATAGARDTSIDPRQATAVPDKQQFSMVLVCASFGDTKSRAGSQVGSLEGSCSSFACYAADSRCHQALSVLANSQAHTKETACGLHHQVL